MFDFIKKPIEDYVKSVATGAAESAGAARKKDIENVSKKAAESVIKPYAIKALVVGGAPLLLGALAVFLTRKRT